MSERLAYDKLDDAARFREQYRFAFSVAIIATCFVIPDDNVIWQYIRYAVGISALFSTLYLIMSAAQLKYREPGSMYEVFHVSESFRMRAFDWSVHIFAAAFLIFLGILLTGLTYNIFGVSEQGWVFWLVLFIFTLCLGLSFILFDYLVTQRKSRKSKKLPRI